MRYTYNLEYVSIFSKNNEILTPERQKVITINYSTFSNIIRLSGLSRLFGFSVEESTIFVNDHRYTTKCFPRRENVLTMTDGTDIYRARVRKYTLDFDMQGPNNTGEMKRLGFFFNYVYKSNIGNINFEKYLPFVRDYEITMTGSKQLEMMAFCAWIIQVVRSKQG